MRLYDGNEETKLEQTRQSTNESRECRVKVGTGKFDSALWRRLVRNS